MPMSAASLVFTKDDRVTAEALKQYEEQAKSLGVSTLRLSIDASHPWFTLQPLLGDFASTGLTTNCGAVRMGFEKKLITPVLSETEMRCVRERAGLEPIR